MRRVFGPRALALVGALVGVLAIGVPNAFATFHGVAQAKTCVSPTNIGSAYTCQGSILNTVDQGGDTIEVTGVSDTVNASGGSVATGNILATTGLVFGGTGTVTCDGHTSGDGSAAHPWLGATDCYLTFGATITTAQFSHYTVVPGDFNIPTTTTLKTAANAGDTTIAITNAATAVPGNTIVIDPTGANPETRVVTSTFNSAPGVLPVVHTITFATPLGFSHLAGVTVRQNAHRLTDTLLWNWNNTCTFDPTGDCTTNAQFASAGASTLVQKLNSSTTTAIHNAAGAPVTVVDRGSIVHDSGTVSGQPGSPNPSGNVNIDFFSGGTLGNECSGTPVNSGPVPLDPSGNFDATGFPQGPLSPGFYGFIAHYQGDGTYNPSDGVCEPLRVVDANIQITPPSAANQVGTDHVLTGHVSVNNGTGYTDAPNGTVISFQLSGPGSFDGPSNCTVANGHGSCTVQIKSTVTGTSTVQATTTVSVAGLLLTRMTGDGLPGDSPNASKTWVDARISIVASSVNEVNHAHTFLVTLEQNNGTGWAPAPGVPVTSTTDFGNIVGGTCGAPANGPTDANGQCTVVVNSATPGTAHVNASGTVVVDGVSIAVATNGYGAFVVDNAKTWVDANIQISPPTAANQVGTDHVLTGHVSVNNGTGFTDAPDGTVISFQLSGPGSFDGPSNCTVANGHGSCTVQIKSTVTGTSTVQASTTVTVLGVPLTRMTGDGLPGDSPNASKTWVDARISIVESAVNQVNQAHVFTVTVEQNDGTGWAPAPGVAITSSSSGVGGIIGGSCGAPATGPTDGNGQCTVAVNSPVPGTAHVNASGTVVVDGVSIAVATNGYGAFVVHNAKTWVDARISIADSATNEINHSHTFTVTVETNSGTGWVPAPGVAITSTTDFGNIVGGTCGAPANGPTDANGQCTVVVNSATPGMAHVNASGTVVVGGVPIAVATNGYGAFIVHNTKTWEDANISIAPNATNEVGQPHTFTVTVRQNDGLGAGYVPAVGVPVTVTLTSLNGANAVPSTSLVGTTNASGQFQVTFTSATAGQVIGNAATSFALNGVTLTRTTGDSNAGDSGPATKTFVDANIQITPSATNEVGQPHTFTVLVLENDGSGTGFVPAANAPVTVTLTSQNGANAVPQSPLNGTTNASGQFQVTFVSATPGQVIGNAATNFTLGGVTLTRSTGDSHVGDSGPATKTYVDARISIAPNGTNAVGATHTFTAHVDVNDGSGSGFQPASAGTVISFSIAAGGVGTLTPASCTTTGTTGSCSVTDTSSTAGVDVVSATTTVAVGGIVLTRTTDTTHGSSGPATKQWVDARISITPNGTNAVGATHTFTGHVDVNPGTGFVNAPAGTVINFSIAAGGVGTLTPTSCTTVGTTGSCSVTDTSSTAGVDHVTASTSVTIHGTYNDVTLTRATDTTHGSSGPATKEWVDAKISITPNGTNAVGATHTFTGHVDVNPGSGFVNAPAGTVINFSIAAGGVGTLTPASCTTVGTTGSCSVTDTSLTAGVDHVTASTSVTIHGTFNDVTLTRVTDTTHGSSGPATKTWVDAYISITPQNATNPLNVNHVLTITVTATNGGNLAAGTATATILPSSTTGSFVGSPSCTYSGGAATASCTVTITSATPGTTVVQASSTIGFANATGSVTRTTGTAANQTAGCQSSCGNANKTWEGAKITISPSATNEINHTHTFTATVYTNTGSGYQTAPAGTDCNITLTASNGATPNPAGPLHTVTNASGQCSITFTSPTPGKVVGHASSTLSVNGQSLTVQTDGTGDNSGDAVKYFVDANIQITPANATNPVGTNHTLTGHVNVNNGDGAGYVNAPAGTTITFSLSNAGGATAAFVGPSTCTTVGTTGSCTVQISSTTAGTTTITASVTLSAGPTGAGFPPQATLTRTTSGSAGNSGAATKLWADDTIVTHVRDANGNDVTSGSVTGGTVVHDEAQVTRTASTPAAVPNPTGTVTFTLYQGTTCSGTVQATDPNKALSSTGLATSVNFTTPTGANASFSYLAHYNGDLNYPAKNAACEPFNVVGTPPGQILPTQTTCSDYNGGTTALGSIFYSVSGGKIGQNVNPGVFFYYSKITTTVANQVVTVNQTNNASPTIANFQVKSANLFTGTCGTASGFTTSQNAAGTNVTYTITTPGTYIIQVKYDSKSVSGTTAPTTSPTTFTYSLVSTPALPSTTGASFQFVKQ